MCEVSAYYQVNPKHLDLKDCLIGKPSRVLAPCKAGQLSNRAEQSRTSTIYIIIAAERASLKRASEAAAYNCCGSERACSERATQQY